MGGRGGGGVYLYPPSGSDDSGGCGASGRAQAYDAHGGVAGGETRGGGAGGGAGGLHENDGRGGPCAGGGGIHRDLGPGCAGGRGGDRGSVVVALAVACRGGGSGWVERAGLLAGGQLVGAEGSAGAGGGREHTDIQVIVGVSREFHPARSGTAGGTAVRRQTHAQGVEDPLQRGGTGRVRGSVGDGHDGVTGDDAAGGGGGAAGAGGFVGPAAVRKRYGGKGREGGE